MIVLIIVITVASSRVLIPVVLPGHVSALAHRLPAPPPESALQPQEVQEQRAAGQRSLPFPHCGQHQPCNWLDPLVFLSPRLSVPALRKAAVQLEARELFRALATSVFVKQSTIKLINEK